MSSKLSSLLVQYGIITVKRMEEAFQRQVIFGGSLDTILLEMNVLDEPTLLRYLYATSGIPPADLTAINFEKALEQTRIFPQKLAEKYLIVPVNAAADALHVLVTDPPDRGRLDEIGFMLGMTIIPGIVPEFRLYQALEQIYGVKMPLRYAGLVKRIGPALAPELPPDTHGEQARAFPPTADGAPVSRGAAAAAPPEDPPVVEPLGDDETASWDDPFAGAKAETLVGMPTTPLPSGLEYPDGLPPPMADQSSFQRTQTNPQFAPMAQTVTGEIDLSGQPDEPELDPAEQELAERASQTAVGEIDLATPVDEAADPAPPGARPATPSVKRTALGMPAMEPLPPAPSPEPAAQPEPAPVVAAPPEVVEPAPVAAIPTPEAQTIPEPAPELDYEEEPPFDPTPLPFDAAVEALGETKVRDDIFALLLRAVTGYFEHSAVFSVLSDQAIGRMSVTRGVADIEKVARISIPLTLPSIFRSTVETKGYYFGPIYDEGINFGLLAEMDRSVPASAFIMPVLIRNRVVCFLYADDGLRPVDPAVPESLVFISYQISQAFQRLILQAKRVSYSAASQVSTAPGKVAPPAAEPVRTKAAVDPTFWETAPIVSGPISVRAPQEEGILQEHPAEGLPTSPQVQPAFPPLGRPQSGPMTISTGLSSPAPRERPVTTPVADSLKDAGRAITSVGYYSLTDADLIEELETPTSRSPEGATTGEVDVRDNAAPRAATKPDPAVKVDAAGQLESTPNGPRTEDIWSLIDDLEKGGEAGDLAGAALQSMGEPALKLVAFRFPGRLAQDRMGQHGKLPQPSAHGPLIDFMVRMREKGVRFLTELMASDNPEVRYYATFIFSELHVPGVLTQLLDRVFDSAPPVRRVATEVLKAYWQDAELRPVLEHLRAELVGPIPFRRRCAAEVLGALRDVLGVGRLIELAADRDTDTAEAAQRALLLITKQAFGDSRRRWRGWWDKNRDRHRIQWLIDALAHKESECRFLASQELHQLTGETLGYRFDQDRRDRDEALKRWERWWETKGRQRFLQQQ
ncbi:MAG: hypothetical protein ABI333_12000 [bacterium]